jgi:hypothetical protein
MAFLPEAPENQEAKESESSAGPIGMLHELKVFEPHLEIIGETKISGSIDNIYMNLSEGKGAISKIQAQVADSPLIEVNQIDISMNPKSLTSDEKTELKAKIIGTDATISKKSLNALKNLPSLPKDVKEEEPSEPPYKHISQILVKDSSLTLKDQNIKATTTFVDADIENGKVTVEDVKSSLLKTGRNFFKLEKLTASFDPEDLRTNPKPDIKMIVSAFDIKVTKALINSFPKNKKEKETKAPPKIPAVISRVLVSRGTISFPEYPGIGGQKYLKLNDIFGNIYNITLEPGTPLASFVFNATFEGETKMISKGKFDLADSPMQWSVDYKLFDLDMTKLNEELRARIPVTFKEGTFNVFGEAIQRDDEIVGYFKPFLVDAQYMGNEKEFKGIKHFFVEVAGTIKNWLFENDETNTVASKVPFSFKDGELNLEPGEAIWSAIEHGLLETDRVKPRADQYQLKQAQEEK